MESAALGRLRDTDGFDRWRTELLAAGHLAELGPAPEPGPARAAWETRARVFTTLRALMEQEAAVQALEQPIPLRTGSVPPVVWGAAAGVLIGLWAILPFVFALPIAFAIGLVAALIGLALTTVQDRRRVVALGGARAARRAAVVALRRAVAEASGHPIDGEGKGSDGRATGRVRT